MFFLCINQLLVFLPYYLTVDTHISPKLGLLERILTDLSSDNVHKSNTSIYSSLMLPFLLYNPRGNGHLSSVTLPEILGKNCVV